MRGTTLVPPVVPKVVPGWYQGGTSVVPHGKMTTFRFFLRSTLHFDPLFLGQNKGSNKGSIRGQNTCVVPPWYHPGTTFGTTGGTRVIPHGKMTTFQFFLRPTFDFDPLFLGQNKGSNKGSIRGQNTCVVPPWYHPGTTFGTTGGTRVVPHGKMTTFQFFPRSTPYLTPYFWVKIRGQIRGQ